MQLLLEAARLPRRSASVAALAATVGYVLVIGAPAPALRSGVMLAVGAVSRLAQRPTSPWAALALGALAPLVDPRTVLNVGYQLSVAGMAALIAGRTLAERLCADRLDGWRRRVAGELVVSTVASLVSAPLVAWTFGRVSLVGPLANLVAAPVVALAQPMLFLALVAAPLGPLGTFVASAVGPLLAALDAIATVAANVPHAALHVTPTLAAAALCAAAAAALVVACASRRPARAVIVAAACVASVAWLPLLPARRARTVELHMIDVGQGDALALRTPAGRWVLFDAGRVWRGGDMGRRAVIPYVRRRGGSVAAFVLSHPHADHVGGAAAVLASLRPERFVDPAFALGSDVYDGALRAARTAGVLWERVRPGDSLLVDGVAIRFLAPDSAWTAGLRDANLASTVASVRFGRVRFLLVGDAEAEEERWLLDRDPDVLQADVLKVGHHGSATSTTPAFLAAVAPRIALVSVGADNGYGHPNMDVMRALRDAGAEVLRTDQLGSVVVRSDGRTISLEADGATWRLPDARSRVLGARP
jgi:competence protein ComEC